MASKKVKKLSEMTPAELAGEAEALEREAKDRSLWKETAASRGREAEREGWVDKTTDLVSIRFPREMLTALRAIATAEGIGYQTLIKQILHREILRRARERRAHASQLADLPREENEAVDQTVAAMQRAKNR